MDGLQFNWNWSNKKMYCYFYIVKLLNPSLNGDQTYSDTPFYGKTKYSPLHSVFDAGLYLPNT